MRQRSLESVGRRFRRALRRVFTNRWVKEQRVYFVEAGDAKLKRIVFAEAGSAARIAGNLTALRAEDVLPELVGHHGNEVWVEYLAGRPAKADDSLLADALAKLYVTLYRASPRCVPLPETELERTLDDALFFLTRCGVLGAADGDALRRFAVECAPARVWLGFDYVDPRPTNFLWCDDGKLRIIDVESIESNRPLGGGLAKATHRWLAPQRETVHSAMRDAGAAEFETNRPFAELLFLAAWQKRCVLRDKPKLVDAELLTSFLGRTPVD